MSYADKMRFEDVKKAYSRSEDEELCFLDTFDNFSWVYPKIDKDWKLYKEREIKNIIDSWRYENNAW